MMGQTVISDKEQREPKINVALNGGVTFRSLPLLGKLFSEHMTTKAGL
jgi:hypothetical protein